MAPKKKVVKLDPVPEIIPTAEPVPESAPEPIAEPAPEPIAEPELDVDADADEFDSADLMDDDVEFGEEYIDESDDAGPDVFDILSGLFVSRDGDTAADILAGISESLETHNKLMYKLIKILESKS